MRPRQRQEGKGVKSLDRSRMSHKDPDSYEDRFPKESTDKKGSFLLSHPDNKR